MSGESIQTNDFDEIVLFSIFKSRNQFFDKYAKGSQSSCFFATITLKNHMKTRSSLCALFKFFRMAMICYKKSYFKTCGEGNSDVSRGNPPSRIHESVRQRTLQTV